MKKTKKKRKNKYKPKIRIFLFTDEIPLGEQDRITYSYRKDELGNYLEIANASYEARIKSKWISIVRYDSTHGYLHRHTRFSIIDSDELMRADRIIHVGNPHDWLTWSLNDLRTNYVKYRQEFFNRSKKVDNYE